MLKFIWCWIMASFGRISLHRKLCSLPQLWKLLFYELASRCQCIATVLMLMESEGMCLGVCSIRRSVLRMLVVLWVSMFLTHRPCQIHRPALFYIAYTGDFCIFEINQIRDTFVFR